MHNPDESLKNFKTICDEFKLFCENEGKVSEADTRVKFIDRVLKDTLNWNENDIARESHTHGATVGYTDYQIKKSLKPYIIVEAKREGASFALPEASGRRHLKISGILQTSKEVKTALEQVRQYAVDDVPIKYAIATNGYAWIVFQTMSFESWREGQAVIFYSPEDITANFAYFWNLLSAEGVYAGSLEKEFASIPATPRGQHRVLSNIPNADIPLERNRLHSQLHPVIQAFLGDIADQEEIKILESCYVHSRSVKTATMDLDNVINDEIPGFLKKQGAQTVLTGAKDSGAFDSKIGGAIERGQGHLYLLLGGIGSGKTTFLKRYIRITGAEALRKHTVYFYLSLLGPPANPADVEKVVYEQILKRLRSDYRDVLVENRKTINTIFADKLDFLYESTFRAEGLSPTEREKRATPYLEKWADDIVDYVPRLLKLCKERGRAVVFFIDNMDQLSPEYQTKVFLLAQKITRDNSAITVLSLREESYHAANTQKTLTAYANTKFHIASPRFRKLIASRLDYASKVLLKSDAEIQLILKSGIVLDKKEIISFFQIIQNSIFVKSKNIARFIEAICHGNMRLALDMFSTFLISGATDVDKMLKIFQGTGEYQVAFHEYIKSVMLTERLYYKETRDNPIMNIFDCGTDRNSSHFTTLRILRLLGNHVGEYSPEGRGFVEINRIMYEFESNFDNRDDFARALNRMVAWHLVELNTRAQDTIRDAMYVRVTNAGYYYLTFLVPAFCYLDLVLQDTPINDVAVVKSLSECVKKVDNLSAKDSEKVQRLEVRFERVKRFIDYLQDEETAELKAAKERHLNPLFDHSFVDDIRKKFNEDQSWIQKRLKENHEDYTQELCVKESEPFNPPTLYADSGVYAEEGDEKDAT